MGILARAPWRDAQVLLGKVKREAKTKDER
jgi:hypothetical protein